MALWEQAVPVAIAPYQDFWVLVQAPNRRVLMLQFAVNHMSVAKLSYANLLKTARAIECAGIEVRNDLPCGLFDGLSPTDAGELAARMGLKIFAVAEVKAFNRCSDRVGTNNMLEQAKGLMEVAVACKATGIALIPRCDGEGCGTKERIANLRTAVNELKPMLQAHNLTGFIEPLGFAHSSLRSKRETIDVLEACDATGQFQLVHDTFHHFLAGASAGPDDNRDANTHANWEQLFPEHTGMVHVSGVADNTVAVSDLQDSHRVLVDSSDQLQNILQLQGLYDGGYRGPVSMEAFAPEVHDFVDPEAELSGSFNYIASSVEESVMRGAISAGMTSEAAVMTTKTLD